MLVLPIHALIAVLLILTASTIYTPYGYIVDLNQACDPGPPITHQ